MAPEKAGTVDVTSESGYDAARARARAVSTRSKLLMNVLRAWDQSVEGALYLDWLAQADPKLDGGLVLREAVLEWNETEEPAGEHVERALAEFCARLSPGAEIIVRAKTAEIVAARVQIAHAIRESVRALRRLRGELGCGRLEALKKLAEFHSDAADASQAAWKRIAALQELSARTAALRRTTAEPLDKDDADPKPGLARKNNTEELDRYYSYQLAARLEQIAERASALEPVQLNVTSDAVKNLFHEAHEAYLYGFDVACIALCRSLIDHALKDRLSVSPSERPALRALIDRARRGDSLDEPGRRNAEEVEEAGNKAMHNLSNLRRTAGEVLASTRKVLNKLYAT